MRAMASLETREPKTKTQQSILAAVVTLLANGLWFWVAGALDELGLVWQSYQPGVAIVIGWAAIGAIGMPLLFSERHRPLGRGGTHSHKHPWSRGNHLCHLRGGAGAVLRTRRRADRADPVARPRRVLSAAYVRHATDGLGQWFAHASWLT